MMNKLFGVLIFTLLSAVCIPPSFAANASHGLIALSSQQGSALFLRSYQPTSFWPLNRQFVTQANRTYCSIASSVMILNALAVPGPEDATLKPWHFFTQENFFTPAVKKIVSQQAVQKQGSTLDQISRALKTFPVHVTTIHANHSSPDHFRTLAAHSLRHAHTGIIVNYLRTTLQQTGAGHMSPLAAYDKPSDRFLVLDVSRYRYPPVWVKTIDLWNAMHTIDPTSHAFRGFILVENKPIKS